MIFNENRLLADDSHEISHLIFLENWERFLKKLSSAAVVIGALRVKNLFQKYHQTVNQFEFRSAIGH